jgi:hypothetical protein
MVNRMSADDYRKLLDEAGDEAEGEADESLLSERLSALGLEQGEAERLAAQADKPRERSDGKVIGLQSKPARPLTGQQIAFAQGVIEGKPRRQAYREAYPEAKGSDATISAAAHKLARDPRIQKMIADGWGETTEALADDLQATKRYVMRSLVALSKAGKQEGSRLKALELLGRHAGMWQAQQAAPEQPVTAEQLRRELNAHLKLVGGKREG